jgi:hypothetical protein
MSGPFSGAIVLSILAASSIAIADPDVPEQPKRVPAQQPVTVTCEVAEVWATHGKAPKADPAINKQLAKRLGNSLKHNVFKLESNNNAALVAKKAQSIKLAKGTATITLIETVNKSQARLTVDFNAAKGNSKQTVLVSAGDYVIVSVNQSGDATADAHVLAVGSCK